MKDWLFYTVGVGGTVFVMSYLGYIAGGAEGRRAAFEEARRARESERSECICGATQSCAFGPGIVGVQRCETGSVMQNQWSRCEPRERQP